ncbi:hypothetical protein METBIDRAFT_110843 [Metschnikowia bicuspidata var. bicuspidata NRRL YB-4993]|uniref:Uncharacterized protein n=1 Tax=Metschnikowia bicuspidata var. bicuspidata NRRL YB-4993 TaxID=869754 RepID=A0A1A0HI80_9ASCO|nr:hypothetical protein METBIDRAFT_110843 [Metschnikowia bicuspidata var. bicuspidata NRRL YB-4993]OBA23706.1 hypothetical protein METBIDRAFT_110843 [Metschnikowia bicuspidata var. bicuspidata NRRL YB-4993]
MAAVMAAVLTADLAADLAAVMAAVMPAVLTAAITAISPQRCVKRWLQEKNMLEGANSLDALGLEMNGRKDKDESTEYWGIAAGGHRKPVRGACFGKCKAVWFLALP